MQIDTYSEVDLGVQVASEFSAAGMTAEEFYDLTPLIFHRVRKVEPSSYPLVIANCQDY